MYTNSAYRAFLKKENSIIEAKERCMERVVEGMTDVQSIDVPGELNVGKVIQKASPFESVQSKVRQSLSQKGRGDESSITEASRRQQAH